MKAFYALWLEKARTGLPPVSQFDFEALTASYPLLARIGMDASGKTLMWLDVANAARWPFRTPVKNRPVVQSVPPPSIKRVIAAFHETLSSGVPDYYETTSWSNGGQTVSLARIAVPVRGEVGPELLAYWEVLEPESFI